MLMVCGAAGAAGWRASSNQGTTVFLFHADVEPWVDSSSYGHTITESGTVTLDTTNQVFGAGAALQSTSPVGHLVVTNNAIKLGSGSFTIEFFFRPTSRSGTVYPCICGTTAAWAANGWYISDRHNSELPNLVVGNYNYNSGAPHILKSTTSISNATTYYCCVQRNGNNFSLYMGTPGGTATEEDTATWSGSWDGNSGGNISILNAQSATSTRFYGMVDEMRITKGAARYSGSSFSVPSSAFTG